MISVLLAEGLSKELLRSFLGFGIRWVNSVDESEEANIDYSLASDPICESTGENIYRWCVPGRFATYSKSLFVKLRLFASTG